VESYSLHRHSSFLTALFANNNHQELFLGEEKTKGRLQ